VTTLEGRRLGRYRLEALLGRGGMAEVWRAVDEKLGRTVAVKVIHAAHAEDRGFVERFLREARLVASLEHPNILPVYDFGEEAGLPFLVMPWLEGGTLRDRMPGRPAPLADAAGWISQLAGALDAAHEAGILHRDVKPANVLIGKGDRLFLADFGIAKMLEAQGGLTATGMVVGTPLYMAPEQAQGKPATPATDRYALAVIAYELLAGAPPFEGESPLSLMHQHVTDAPPALSTKVRGLPAGLDGVLAAALSKDPASRPPSCRALADAIGIYLPTGAAAAAPPTAVWPPPAAAASPTVRQPGAPRPSGPAKGTVPWPPPDGAAPPTPTAARPVATPAPGLTSEETVFTGPARGKKLLFAGLAAGAVVAAAVTGAVLLRTRNGPDARPPSGAPSATPAPPAAAPNAVTAPSAVPSGPATSPATAKPDGDAKRISELESRLRRAESEIASRKSAAPSPAPPPTAVAVSDDVALAAAFLRLDAARSPTHRLSAGDFEFARETAGRVLKARPENAEARTLDVYAAGGLDYVARRDAAAGQALLDAFLQLKRLGRREARPLAFLVRRPDGGFRVPSGWELALAYGDARGEAEGLLDAARAKTPDNLRVLVGFAALRRLQGKEGEAKEFLRSACQKGLSEACREAGLEASENPLRRRPAAGR
jgi:serine/threonine protein kinase